MDLMKSASSVPLQARSNSNNAEAYHNKTDIINALHFIVNKHMAGN